MHLLNGSKDKTAKLEHWAINGATPPGANAGDILETSTRNRKAGMMLSGMVSAALLFMSNAVFAGMPERGLYWQSTLPHQGYYIEHQNDTAVLIVFAFDEQGHAEWFSASGTLQEGTTLDTESPDLSLYHHFTAPLVRLSNGPVLGFSQHMPHALVVPNAKSIGTVTVNVTPSAGVFLDLESLLPGGPLRRVRSARLERFNFGFGGYGRSLHYAHLQCWPNLEGEWLFMDRLDRSRPVWRFKFGTARVRAWDAERRVWLDGSQMTCGVNYQSHEIIYSDDAANADLRCASTYGVLPPDFPMQAHACEIIDRTSQQTILMFYGGSSGEAAGQRVLGWFDNPREQRPPATEYPTVMGIRIE